MNGQNLIACRRSVIDDTLDEESSSCRESWSQRCWDYNAITIHDDAILCVQGLVVTHILYYTWVVPLKSHFDGLSQL